MFNLNILYSSTFSVSIERPGDSPSPFSDLGVFLTTLLSFFLIITALASFIYLILGGFQYITSAGDKVHIQTARDRIMHAVLGLAIVAGAAALFSVLGAVFGINIFGTIVWPTP